MTKKFTAPVLDMSLLKAKEITDYFQTVMQHRLNDSQYAEVVGEVKILLENNL